MDPFTLGSFTLIDLIAATTNAFNGALLARRPEFIYGKNGKNSMTADFLAKMRMNRFL
jgi:hypothetical protein